MLMGLVAHHIAYTVVVAVALSALWWRGELTRAVLSAATVFCIVVVMAPIALIWFRNRAAGNLPKWTNRVPAVREVLSALAEVPPNWRTDSVLVAKLALLQMGVFLLDAGTLGTMLLALASPAAPDVILASFVIASVAATLGWMPGGLGTFDATCVAMLHWHGVTLAGSLAATLLLRSYTFWLPMIPGLWLARRELHALVARRT
jgi:uncharacterized membrane protein YbhN (UPF0104 family)